MHLGVAEEDRGAGAVVECCNSCVAQAVEEGARSMSELRRLGKCWTMREGGHDFKWLMSQVKEAACRRRSRIMRQGSGEAEEQREGGRNTRRSAVRRRKRERMRAMGSQGVAPVREWRAHRVRRGSECSQILQAQVRECSLAQTQQKQQLRCQKSTSLDELGGAGGGGTAWRLNFAVAQSSHNLVLTIHF